MLANVLEVSQPVDIWEIQKLTAFRTCRPPSPSEVCVRLPSWEEIFRRLVTHQPSSALFLFPDPRSFA